MAKARGGGAKGKKKMGGGSSKKNVHSPQSSHQVDEGWANVDPSRVRFQHSRIRPYFSGCGRAVADTLQAIRDGKLRVEDLPPILVISGGAGGDNDEREGKGVESPWYFSLNNRRLWVLKRCREEGLLDGSGGLIRVRVRQPRSEAERSRYTVQNCALEAKFMRERPQAHPVGADRPRVRGTQKNAGTRTGQCGERSLAEEEETILALCDEEKVMLSDSSDIRINEKTKAPERIIDSGNESDDDSSSSEGHYVNPFSVLMGS